jgi:putative glutamine amidotransferase
VKPAGEPPLLIGVSSRVQYPDATTASLGGVFTKTLHYLEQSVAHWVLSGHAVAVMIPAVTRDSIVTRGDLNLDDYAAALDGLVLQGGADIAPESYGEVPLRPEWQGDRLRDLHEIALIDAFMAAGKPIFGICRGLQMLNVKFGGTLFQDIATQLPAARSHREHAQYEKHGHEIEIVAGTRLSELCPGVTRASANSIHHQGIKDLAPDFVVEARCPDDGIIEAVRRRGSGYVAAVQWHPEFHDGSVPGQFDDTAVLKDFLQAARTARKT